MPAAAYVEDVLLVDRCLTGEPAATRELFRRHRTRVHACLFRVLGGNRDMDDLLQEAFLQVFRSLRGWRAEASLATWIDRVAVRCAYRYLSQRGRRVSTEPLDDEAAEPAAPIAAGPGARRQLARDGVVRLYAALDELSPAARLAFTLHEIDGRSLAETAALVGSSVTATKLRVWRARKRIETAAAADPVLSEFLAPTAGGDVIRLDDREGTVKLAGRIVVEPLDDERMTSIERRVVAGAAGAAAQGLRAPWPRGRWLAAAAVVAAGVVGWLLHGAPMAGPVAEVAPIGVATTAERAVVDIGDARIASDPATEFAVTRPAGGVVVAMTRGKLELEVGKRGDRPPLVVRAGDTDVIVVGTRFTVDYGDGRGEVAVRVTEGAVRVIHHQRETRVAAGEAWHSRGDGGLVATADRAPRSEPAGAPARAAGTAVTARTEDQPATNLDVALGPVPEVLHDRTAAVPDAPAMVPARPAPAALPARPPTSEALRRRAVARASDPRLDLRTAIRDQRVEPALELGEPNPASAVAKYYDIAAHKSGDEASQAFYSIAVVRHERLARDADALQVLDAYVRRFPGGKEYRAALWLRVRILCLSKIDDRCRAAAYTYLHEAPDGPAARVAELLTLAE